MWRGLSLTEPVHCHPPSHPPRSSRQHLRSPCESRQPISWTSVALTLAFQELFWLHEKEAGWRTNHDEVWQDLGDWPLSFTTLSKVPQTQKAYQSQPGFSHFPDIHLEDRGGGDLSQGRCSIYANLTILPSPWSKEHKRSHYKFYGFSPTLVFWLSQKKRLIKWPSTQCDCPRPMDGEEWNTMHPSYNTIL